MNEIDKRVDDMLKKVIKDSDNVMETTDKSDKRYETAENLKGLAEFVLGIDLEKYSTPDPRYVEYFLKSTQKYVDSEE